MTETTKEYIQRYRAIYNEIKLIKCKLLSVDIAFTTPGFKHLIFKGSHRRSNKIIKSRLRLLPLAVPVLKNATKITETRVKKEIHYGTEVNVRYDALENYVGKSKIRVRVIIRTIGSNGKPHFYSIMKY